MTRKPYPTGLTDREWDCIQPLLPLPSPLGSPRTVDLREILNALFYGSDNGIKWRALPHEFPPWSTVYDYFRRWVRTGRWEQINTAWVERVRTDAQRNPQPTLAIIDSQSLEMAQKVDQNVALMRASESKAASATWLRMGWDSHSTVLSVLPTLQMSKRHQRCWFVYSKGMTGLRKFLLIPIPCKAALN